jgi:4-amino-4-deoxy-L-arabinose transferase-like glycosyltransferase
MAATGVCALPHLNGEVYRQRPPLFFRCSAPLERLGLGMAATRVVTGVAVCGVLWVLYLLCRRRLGSGAALLKAPVLSP